MKAQPFEKAIPTCPVCGNAMPEGFITHSIPADTVGIKCKNITTGKLVTAYHVDKSGAAHNKSNTECIGCIGVDLIPL
jgi:hypothetical protein